MPKLSRNNRFLLFLVGLLAFTGFFLDQPFPPTPVIAPVFSGSGPPPAGDWVIASDTVIEDEQYLLNGSIVIESGANLTLTNVTLWMNCAADGEFNIMVNSGGELYLHNCTVTAYNIHYRWFLAAKAGSTLLLNATTISYAGYTVAPPYGDGRYSGVWISTDNAKVINCTMVWNYCGLWLYQANDTLIEDNHITLSLFDGISIRKANNTILEANSITNSSRNGIYLISSSNNTVSGNTVTNSSEAGIWLGMGLMFTGPESPGNNTVSGNTVTNSGYAGIYLYYSGNNNIITGNTVTNSSDYDGISLYYSGNNNTVSGNTVANNLGTGIGLHDSGNNNTISGNTVMNNYGSGIWLSNFDQWISGQSTMIGNTVTKNTVTNNSIGIELVYSDNNSTVSGNTITNSRWRGIYLHESSNNTISENTVTNSSESGIKLVGSNNTVSGNTITNSGDDGIFLNDSNQNTVSGNTITNSGDDGIMLYESGHSTVTENTFMDSGYSGILLQHSDNSTVCENMVTNSGGNGIKLLHSGNSTVCGNTVTNSSLEGIWLFYSAQTTVSENTVTNNTHGGIYLNASAQSTVCGNTVTNSSHFGISLDQTTSDCLLWGNTLSMNTKGNTLDSNGTNQWDNGTHGNWYDDYTGPDLNQDGVGDSPYSIGGGLAEDRYPLMNIVPQDTGPPTLDSPADVTYTVGTTGHTITWQPSDANPYWYQIFRDGVAIANTTWDGTAITLALDGLAVGTYNYTIVVLDRLGYRTTDEVLVKVEPAEEETTEEETTEEDPQRISGFVLPLVGLTFAVGWFLTRSRRRIRY
ncbi:MAG: nitrous oxide reductase family maturation protein NosD [Candidatus Hodarchaeota archaeon]